MQVRYEKVGRTGKNRFTGEMREPIDKAYYICQTYNRMGCKVCSSHKIEARDLYNLVLKDIQELAAQAMKDADAFYQRLSRRMEHRYLVDASQTAGVLPIDMQAMNIDVVCFTGHKSLLGPQGTGGLCIAPGVDIRPFKVGGTGVQTYLPQQPPQYPTRLEAGTLNGHGIAGLSAALDYLEETGLETIRSHEQALARQFYEGVSAIPGVTVYGDFTTWDRAPVVSLNIRDYDSSQVSDVLAEQFSIATRPGAHCAPRLHRALGTMAQGAVRFSFGWFNTEEETQAAIAAVRSVAE